MKKSQMFTQEFENYLFTLKNGNNIQQATYHYLTYEELYSKFLKINN